jgi:4-amino-4-deoxy-L-arabinose transferase-like glycosyltransferase
VTSTIAETGHASGGSVFRAQQSWVMPSLALIVVVTLTLYTWNIGYSGISPYYAAAAKSMSQSWRAMFFGALNPSATTTLDKLAGFLVPQALSVRIFGFSAWALSLPQAIEGAVTIIASYAVGARWRGARFGIALAALMAVTPMLAAMFGRPMEDGMLTMSMVLAFGAIQRAVSGGRILWVLVSVAWVAVGFQAKMLQAWLILPALGIAWLVGSSTPLRHRMIGLAAATGGVVALSLGWMTAIQLVPAADRPYIDGSTNNNIFAMVFGYNGFDRILPGLVPGALPQLVSAQAGVVNGTATSAAGHSVFKLLLPEFTTQIGWLLPLAVVGLVLELAALRRRQNAKTGPGGSDRAMVFGLALWLLVPAVVLSAAFVPHATYFAEIALPLGAFAIAGGARCVQLYRSRRTGLWLVLPALILVQAGWTVSIILSAPASLQFLVVPVIVLGVGSAGVLLGLRALQGPHGDSATNPRVARATRVAIGAAALGAVLAPVTWSLCVLGPGGGGSASDAFAGPRIVASYQQTIAGAQSAVDASAARPPLLRPPFEAPPTPVLDADQTRLYRYISDRNGSRSLLFATDSLPIAVNFQLDSDADTVPVGGFSRQAPDPMAGTVQRLVGTGALRFVLLNGDIAAAGVDNPGVSSTRAWVRQHCNPVLRGRFNAASGLTQQLFDCATRRSGGAAN